MEKQTASQQKASSSIVQISLCGDVMTGRGVDQIMRHPGDPQIHELYAENATEYVRLAERLNGPISKPVAYSYVWGDSLDVWNVVAPDVRIINLETAITASDDFWPGKGIHYRMNPQNVACICGANIDCCAIANNHILDWGYAGLSETLTVLRRSAVKTAGAGMNIAEAAAPAILEIPGKGRVLLFAFGSVSSGIPVVWRATQDRAGINLLEDLSIDKIDRIGQSVEQVAREGDIVVASIHWGPNWGYEVTQAESDFAHALINDARVDLIYGHSSHHVKRIENYRGRLILYGCGDFLDDYEGISGYEQFRGDLGLMYFVSVEPSTGKLSDLQMIPTQMRRMSVRRARATDVSWMKNVINRESGEFGINVDVSEYHGFPSLGLTCQ